MNDDEIANKVRAVMEEIRASALASTVAECPSLFAFGPIERAIKDAYLRGGNVSSDIADHYDSYVADQIRKHFGIKQRLERNDARTRWLVMHVDQGHGIRKREGFDECSCGAVFIEGTINGSEFTIGNMKTIGHAELQRLVDEAAGALRFILAFYGPNRNPHLDTEAWKQAEAGGRRVLAELEVAALARVVPRCSCQLDVHDFHCPIHGEQR